tara:strand:+ start:3372 stop:3776 length:405 start_codon:yes stop_codon:yes gene_type:complete
VTISIKNKIEVLAGNKILVPGCEPVSAFTSNSLAENRDCNATVVDLADALEAVTGSTVIYMSNPRRKFFVLPDGPPPSPDICGQSSCKREDWYQKLRDIGSEIGVDNLSCNNARLDKPRSVGEICSAFPLKGIF